MYPQQLCICIYKRENCWRDICWEESSVFSVSSAWTQECSSSCGALAPLSSAGGLQNWALYQCRVTRLGVRDPEREGYTCNSMKRLSGPQRQPEENLGFVLLPVIMWRGGDPKAVKQLTSSWHGRNSVLVTHGVFPNERVVVCALGPQLQGLLQHLSCWKPPFPQTSSRLF